MFAMNACGGADDRQITKEKKKEIIEAFSRALKAVCPKYYVAAPDMNTAEQEMEWFMKANGDKKSCTGKSKKLGGIPHELGRSSPIHICSLKTYEERY